MGIKKEKYPSESLTTMVQMVMPNDTNPLNNLMGGKLMEFMDIAAAIAAQRHSHRVVVTASVDNVSFERPIAMGQVVTLEAKVTRAFNSSMEVFVQATAEDIISGKKVSTNKAFLTFVAVDQVGNPIQVPSVVPQSQEEQVLFEGALRRRQLRLVLAGRIKPSEATELRALFDDLDKKNA
ncbi:MAG: acyl-CoA thioesterase [Bernardetiaceae bacterium]